MVGEPLEPSGNMANEGASATNGVLCHLAGLDGSGVRKETAWKAWTLADGSTNLRWELRRGVVADCGFLDAKTTRLSVATGSWVTRAESLAHLFDFEKGAFAGRSMKALRVRGEEPEVGEGFENVAWVSTAALVLSLCSWLETRKKEQHKTMIKTTAVLFFEKVLPVGVAQGLDFTSPGGGAQNLCTIGPVLSGRCFCLGQALGSIARTKTRDSSPQSSCFHALFHLYCLRQCAAIRAWAKHLVDEIALAIEVAVCDWGDFAWHRKGRSAGE